MDRYMNIRSRRCRNALMPYTSHRCCNTLRRPTSKIRCNTRRHPNIKWRSDPLCCSTMLVLRLLCSRGHRCYGCDDAWCESAILLLLLLLLLLLRLILLMLRPRHVL